MIRFQEWIREYIPDLSEKLQFLTTKQKGWGVFAKVHFESEQEWIRVPRQLMITEEEARQSPLGQALSADSVVQAFPSVLLAAFLCWEDQRCDSFWRSYLDTYFFFMFFVSLFYFY